MILIICNKKVFIYYELFIYINVIDFLFFNILKILLVILPVLIGVAYITLVERKIIASIQKREGPNVVGFLGLLQPIADVLNY